MLRTLRPDVSHGYDSGSLYNERSSSPSIQYSDSLFTGIEYGDPWMPLTFRIVPELDSREPRGRLWCDDCIQPHVIVVDAQHYLEGTVDVDVSYWLSQVS